MLNYSYVTIFNKTVEGLDSLLEFVNSVTVKNAEKLRTFSVYPSKTPIEYIYIYNFCDYPIF